MDAGKLRHRVDIEQRVDVQDTSGDIETTWVPFASSVPAAIEPLSAREFVAAGAVQSKVIARITIRHRSGLDASMRIRHGARIYNPEGFLADKESGLDYLTIPCSEGVNEG
ncbi:MAG TPA: phage head closure protein [Mycolicibacterium fallax]|nr:phage head closure protein [Mycolicibacterium fallax]